jgi:hypothetical protein
MPARAFWLWRTSWQLPSVQRDRPVRIARVLRKFRVPMYASSAVRFSYRAYEVDGTPASGVEGGRIYRPVVPFSIIGSKGLVDFFGLLDTGADESYITREMAERLGLDVNDTSKYVIESAGGEISVGYSSAVIEVRDGNERYRWSVTIGITDQEWPRFSATADFLNTFTPSFAVLIEK